MRKVEKENQTEAWRGRAQKNSLGIRKMGVEY